MWKIVLQLVVNKSIYAKIDRPAGVVSFQQTKDPSKVLNEWPHDLKSVMTLVTNSQDHPSDQQREDGPCHLANILLIAFIFSILTY